MYQNVQQEKIVLQELERQYSLGIRQTVAIHAETVELENGSRMRELEPLPVIFDVSQAIADISQMSLNSL